MKANTVAEIQRRASGIFLWVILVVRILNVDGDWGYAHKLEARLKEIPNGLNELFQDIIHRGTQDDIYLIPTLQWIMFSMRPLNCPELYHAIMGHRGEITVEDEELGLDSKNMENFLLNSSKGFAETTKGKQPTVQFIHESVRDYLRDTGFQTLAHELSLNLEGASHEYLKQCCLHFISGSVIRRLGVFKVLPNARSSEAKALRERAKKLFPFLGYAIDHAISHAEREAACGLGSAHRVASFAETFPLSTWSVLDNLFERFENRRLTTPVTAAHVLTKKVAILLLDVELQCDPELSTTMERQSTLLDIAIHSRDAGVVSTVLEHGALTRHSPDAQETISRASFGTSSSLRKWRSCYSRRAHSWMFGILSTLRLYILPVSRATSR